MWRMLARIAPILLLLPLQATTSAQTVADRVDAYMATELAKRHVPGASVAVMRDGEIVLAKGYGTANLALGVAATPETVYEIGSITKQFTATLIMMLREERKIGLDDSVLKYLTDLPKAWSGITIRHLLTHTSGIKSYTSLPTFTKTLRQDFTPRQLVGLVEKIPLEFPPGTKFAYNNTGYVILGMAIERVSAKSYGEFLRERILGPLHMDSTLMNDLRAVIKNRASGYEWTGKEYLNAEFISMTQPFSAGVLVSTVLDMAKWDAALNGDKLLKRSSLEEMWTPYRLKNGQSTGYGFGWGIANRSGHRGVAHGGGIPGFTSDFRRLLDDHVSVVVFTNSGRANPDSMAQAIAAMFVPTLKTTETPVGLTDTDPVLTARLRKVLEDVIAGKADRSDFTPKMQELLFGTRAERTRNELRSYGPIERFTLVADSGPGKRRARQYRAQFRHKTIDASFALDERGRIQGLGVREP